MWFNQIKHTLKLNKKVVKFNELKEQIYIIYIIYINMNMKYIYDIFIMTIIN